MAWSESRKEIATALAKAQGEMESAKFDSDNPHFKSKFASFASVVAACQHALAKNGISRTHDIVERDGQKWMVTELSHASGEWFRCEFPMPVDRMTMQSLGSANTYAKRYSLTNAVGLATEAEEDDGTAASAPHVARSPIAKPVPSKPLPIKPHNFAPQTRYQPTPKPQKPQPIDPDLDAFLNSPMPEWDDKK